MHNSYNNYFQFNTKSILNDLETIYHIKIYMKLIKILFISDICT